MSIEVLPFLVGNGFRADPGIFLLGLQSNFDRVVKIVFVLDHVAQQSRRLQWSSDDMLKWTCFDRTLAAPRFANSLLPRLYGWSFWYYAVFVRLCMSCSLFLYLYWYWTEVSTIWRIAYPILWVFFVLIDADVYVMLFRRSCLTATIQRSASVCDGLSASPVMSVARPSVFSSSSSASTLSLNSEVPL